MKARIGQFISPLLFFLVGIGIAVVLIGLVYWYLNTTKVTQREHYMQKQLETFTSTTKVLQRSFDTTAQTVFETLINTPKIQGWMAQASHASPDRQEQIRNDLYRELFKAYERLEQNDLRQLHFHLPDSISFLRFHRPHKFGDSLQTIRPTIDQVNRTHQPVSGFEEGRIYNGFRHVFPLFYDDRFVGSVELSYSFDAIRKYAKELYPAHYELILRKTAVHEKVMKDEQDNYKNASLNESFYVDTNLKEEPNPHYSNRLIKEIDASITDEIALLLPDNRSFVVVTQIDGKDYLVIFDPLKSFNDEPIGYIVTYVEDGQLQVYEDNFKTMWLIASIVIVLGCLLLSWLTYRILFKEHMLKELAHYDVLTGVYNRRAINDKLMYMAGYSIRYARPMTLIFMDIDHFKKINDTYGHSVGDTVLSDVAELVRTRLRESDLLGRWGGEEFLIGLPNTGLKEAIGIAEELRQSIASHPYSYGHVTCSFGVAQLRREEGFAEWINRADKMLYDAKAAGRNQVCADAVRLEPV